MRRSSIASPRTDFRQNAMAPVYGLAENCGRPSRCRRPGEPSRVDRWTASALTTRGTPSRRRRTTPTPIELVACGQPIPDHEIRIVDDTGRELGDRREGRLEFRGPSATSGYFQNPAKTRELFRRRLARIPAIAPTWPTAISSSPGAIKDIIIRAGQHIAPHEIEEAVGAVPGLRKNGVAAFGVTDPASGTERVVVLAETDETRPSAQAGLKVRAQEAATHIVGGPPDEVVLVRRARCRRPRAARSGEPRRATSILGKNLVLPQRALWWQIARLSIAGLGTRISQVGRIIGELLYAAWWWTVIATGFLLGWLAVMTLPRLTWRWAAIRALARTAPGNCGSRCRSAASKKSRQAARYWRSITRATWTRCRGRRSSRRTDLCRQEGARRPDFCRSAAASPRSPVSRAI